MPPSAHGDSEAMCGQPPCRRQGDCLHPLAGETEILEEEQLVCRGHSSSEIIMASGRVAGVCSSTILKMTVKGTARTIPTKPQSRLQNARPISTISGLRPSALPVILGSIRLAVML